MNRARLDSDFALLEANGVRSDALVIEARRLKTKALSSRLSLAEIERVEAIGAEMQELLLMRRRLLAHFSVASDLPRT